MRIYKKTYTKVINGVRVTKETKDYYGRLKIATGGTVHVRLDNDMGSSLHMFLALQTTHDLIKGKIQSLEKEFEAFMLNINNQWGV